MKSSYDRFTFDDPNAAILGFSQAVSRFAGMPAGIELADRFLVETWEPAKPADQRRLVDNPSSPGETADGLEWAHDQFTASTVTVADTGFPAYLRIATGTGSTNGQQMQACKGLPDATGAATTDTRTLYNTAAANILYFSATVRFSDANNDAATTNDPFWYFGFAPVTANITSGATHHVGFGKFFNTNEVRFGSNQISSMPWADTAYIKAFDMGTLGLVNKWFTMSFLCAGMNPTAQRGTGYVFLDLHNTPLGSTNFAPTHVGTLDMSIASSVPNASMCPSVAMRNAVTAIARNVDIAKIVTAASYKLNV